MTDMQLVNKNNVQGILSTSLHTQCTEHQTFALLGCKFQQIRELKLQHITKQNTDVTSPFIN